MGLFTTLIRVMEFNQTPKGLNFPFCYQFIKRPASFNTFQKAEGASYSTLMKTPWFSTKPQATGKNWPWPHKDKNYWIILYKVEAPTCGHPIKTQDPAIDPITLTVFYFPLPYSSPPKYLKALENKVLLNIEERRNWGRCELHRETKGHKDSWEEVKRKLHFTHVNDLTLAWKERWGCVCVDRKLRSTELGIKFILIPASVPPPTEENTQASWMSSSRVNASLCYRLNGNKGLNKKDLRRPKLSERENHADIRYLKQNLPPRPCQDSGGGGRDKLMYLMHLRLSASLWPSGAQ